MIGKTSAGTSAKEEKTVTAGTAQKVVTPSNGKLLSKAKQRQQRQPQRSRQ